MAPTALELREKGDLVGRGDLRVRDYPPERCQQVESRA